MAARVALDSDVTITVTDMVLLRRGSSTLTRMVEYYRRELREVDDSFITRTEERSFL